MFHFELQVLSSVLDCLFTQFQSKSCKKLVHTLSFFYRLFSQSLCFVSYKFLTIDWHYFISSKMLCSILLKRYQTVYTPAWFMNKRQFLWRHMICIHIDHFYFVPYTIPQLIMASPPLHDVFDFNLKIEKTHTYLSMKTGGFNFFIDTE